MKNKRNELRLIAFFLLSTIVLAFFSWIGSVYEIGEVQSLLSAEGVRWMLGHIVEEYVQTPALGIVLILLMGLGVGSHAGLYDALKRLFRKERSLSRKERRALTLSFSVFLVYMLMVGVTLFLPWNFLLGVTGSLLHSPFASGFVYILSVGIGVSGMIFGYVTDTFRSLLDVFEGMSSLLARFSNYYVALFFVVQFFLALTYTRVDASIGLSREVVSVIFDLCSYIPLFFTYARVRK